MENDVLISFAGGDAAALPVPQGQPLSDALDRPDSPVFFGCKTGNCGTCLVEVTEGAMEQLPEPSAEERDWLETLAPGNPRARLACQLAAVASLTLRPL